MNSNVLLTNKSSGNTILFNYDQSFLITRVDWGTIDVSHVTNKYYGQIGESIVATDIRGRIVSITGYVIGSNEEILDQRKRNLEVDANPNSIIRLDVNGVFIEGKPRTTVRWGIDENENNDKMCLFQIEIQCPYSLFMSKDSIREFVSQWEPMFEFDIEWPVIDNGDGTYTEVGIEIEAKSPDLIKNLKNDGDVFSPMVIEFTARASVTNPYIISIDNQHYIKIGSDSNPFVMQTHDVITVDTNPSANIAIMLLRNNVYTNIYGMRDRGSDLSLGLNPGDNLYRYGANSEEDENNLDVIITRYNRFWGCNWSA